MSKSLENGETPSANGIAVNDEDGLVDKRTKQHILNLRVSVDNDERELFVNWPKENPRSYNERKAVEQWSISVKQYLRGIKRLWHDEAGSNDVRNVDYYWREKQIDSYELVPPDKDGYQFSLISIPNMDAGDVRTELGLPRGVDVPQPKTVTIQGLQDVLDRKRIGHSWSVYVEKTGAKPNWEQKILTREVPLPKDLLSQAVEVADDFLQQAGIGFKIGDDLPSWGYEDLGTAIEDDDIEVV